MAEFEGGGGSAPWIAFLAGIVLVALLVGGYFALNTPAPQQEAQFDIDAPRIEAPDINLPDLPEAPPVEAPASQGDVPLAQPADPAPASN